MDKIRMVISIATNNIRKWSVNPRIYILGILLVLLVFSIVEPIKNFSRVMGYRITPWLFPFVSNFVITQIMLLLGIVFLFCDAPFMDRSQAYIFIRSGRTMWVIGQIFYIMLATAIYFLFINFVIVIMLTPNIFFSNEWGKVLGTLAQTYSGRSFNIYLPIDYTIQNLYSPIQAFALSFMLEWSVGIFLGLVIFIANIYLTRAIGAIVATAIILMDIVILNAFPYYINHFSPVSLARLTILDPTGISTLPTDIYAYIFFLVSITLLTVISIFSVKKQYIQVLPHI